MEVWQAQLASDLNSNCYLVLMNEVLKSSWMVEHDNIVRFCNSNGEVSPKAAEAAGGSHLAKLSADVGNSATVIDIDDDSGLEVERACLRTSPDQRYSSRGDSLETTGEREQNKLITGDSSQIRGAESQDKTADCVTGAISDAFIPVKGAGPYQRPATVIESPSWLPQGWTTEVRVREWGNTAGTKDKYYVDPTNGRRFRSRKEVMEYLETGHLSRWKRKAKPEPDGHGQPVSASVAQVECPSASLPTCSIPCYAWSPLQVANNHVNVSSAPYSGITVEKINTQFPSRPPPVEIIDLEAIPDTALSTEARPGYGTSSLPYPSKESSEACSRSEAQAQKFSSSQLHSDTREDVSKDRGSYSGDIPKENANNMLPGAQASSFQASHGANSCEDLLRGTSTYVLPVLNNIHLNLSGVPSGVFPSNLVTGSNGQSNITQMSPFPGYGSTVLVNASPFWLYNMFVPSCVGNHPLGPMGGQALAPDDRTGDKVVSRTDLQGQVQVYNGSTNNPAAKIALSGQIEKGPTCVTGIEKLHKLKRHQEKELLEVLGKKLCREGLALMCRVSETQP